MTASALITGASRGIGLGIAERLAAQGYGLTVTARDASRLDAVAEKLRAAGAPDVVAIAADMADPDAAQVLTGAHQERFGSMRALVLNAGVGTAGPIGEYPMKRFEKTVAVNLTAPLTLLQRALPLLRESAAENPQNGAKVVAVSSITGVYAEANLAVYGATKAALLSLVETLNAEESGNGVAGTAIAPAYVDTDMSEWTKDTIPADTMLTVGDVVELVDAVLRLSNRAVVSKMVLTRAGASGYGA
ncbi:short-chain dehydrogenase [Prescottella equi]|uniref:SDR family NAD(P)-dependent oxidoreductase n=1 Tax=Rhodococcus hoagii TaxID=43767 RepID=UPI000A10FC0F|nr:SDR family oxidoreductase [Prescottella equi]MBM4730511.1 SDR family NAD(P)-dependent oxidoreductase [Prescottella equi]NKR27585.1 SDR family NAD(P)-dependent oxidoreductase [Prescottella equi]ORL33702.1 short-chain dehydrogenase [Prescottella equi]ORL89862.1 short-chain dehydrogenase [Prescottella equi]ORM18938.1 short-chain dehydrogenase [Prescottella equi]